MPFTIALSGLSAASDDLGVTANNIANSNTNGFKKSRSEFAEVYAVSSESLAANTTGSGVRLNSVAQQFDQGNIDFTGNSLDLAIAGEGYEERIFLQGDTNAAYGEVLAVMTQMKNAGFTNIALVTDPKSRVEGTQ